MYGREKKLSRSKAHTHTHTHTHTHKQSEDGYYKLIRAGNFWNNNYIEYRASGNRNKNLLLDGNRYKIRPYLRDIRIDLQESDTWKIQLTIGIKFIS